MMPLRSFPMIGLLAALLSPNSALAQTPVRNPDNDHYYHLIVLPSAITWQEAYDLARNSSFGDRKGYLATVTSARENNFLRNRVYTNPAMPSDYSIWLGGYKLPTSTNAKNGWRWVTGEPWDFTYWVKGEPNNAGVGEDRLIADGQRAKAWNDLPDASDRKPTGVAVRAYLVEYGKVAITAPGKRPAQ